MSNFGFLETKKEFADFAPAAIEAEKLFYISPRLCAGDCRTALELAVNWVYDCDAQIQRPYKDNLANLIYEYDFKSALPYDTWKKLTVLKDIGNLAIHSKKVISREDALLCLKNLFEFIDWIDYSYGREYIAKTFRDHLIPKPESEIYAERIKNQAIALKDHARKQQELTEELARLRKELAAAKEKNQKERHFQPEKISEFKTRKVYIDIDMKLEGWIFDGPTANVIEEMDVVLRKPDGSYQNGAADYVLMGRDGRPLAVVEAKKTSKDPNVGKEQARFYAEALEQKYGRRPMIFLTNGFETYFWDEISAPPRRVSGIFSQEDLERFMNRRELPHPKLEELEIKDSITNRPYQKEAIRAVCANIQKGNRKHLLVMATGTGKTRTAASLVDVLSRGNVITNVLYLADRRELVKQSKNAFHENLPDMSLCNLCSNKDAGNEKARVVFSTYPTILNAIDERKGKEGEKLYSPSHFDLIIIDESHRSIFKKYRAIFEYFDAHLLGLTATPKTEVDRNTYDFFDMENGDPTYAYSYQQAIEEDYLVPYYNYETSTKFIEEGIHYDELSEEDKKRYEDDFAEDGHVPDEIPSSALNRFVFNQDTVDKVITDLMQKGIRTAGGNRIGKTIIFAENKKHAQYIVDRFDALYPKYNGTYAARVVCDDSYVDRTIDLFKVPDKEPYIAVSVDMLDTGIDVPEITNLVFFKKVRSKAKFWQMIGRGTRKCDGIECVDQKGSSFNKKYFYIFDYCSNFEFFRQKQDKPDQTGNTVISLSEGIFSDRISLAAILQKEKYAAKEYQDWRKEMVNTVLGQVKELNSNSAAIRLHMQAVEDFKDEKIYDDLTVNKVTELKKEVAPLVSLDYEDIDAQRFDYFMYNLMLAFANGDKSFPSRKATLMDTADRLSNKTSIDAVKSELPILKKIGTDEFWANVTLLDMEEIRKRLRPLLQYLRIDGGNPIVVTNLHDEVTDEKEGNPIMPEEQKPYKERVEHYFLAHQDSPAVQKLIKNEPITEIDYAELGRIFTQELGSKEEFIQSFPDYAVHLDFGLVVRKIAKMDHKAAEAAFSKFINDENLNAVQIAFIRKVITYVEVNGYMDDATKIFYAPFDRPAMDRIFNVKQQGEIIHIINTIKSNAVLIRA